MYLAIKHYVKTQNYPKTRLEVVETNNSDILSEVLNTLNEINEKSKEEIIIVGKRLLEYLQIIE